MNEQTEGGGLVENGRSFSWDTSLDPPGGRVPGPVLPWHLVLRSRHMPHFTIITATSCLQRRVFVSCTE